VQGVFGKGAAGLKRGAFCFWENGLPENNADYRELLYTETAKVAAVFWEWRHKVMTAVFAAVPTAFAATAWLYQQHFRRALCAPLFLGGALSAVALFLDKRNVRILEDCFRVCGEIEAELRKGAGIFALVGKTHKLDRFTYTRVLHVAYSTIAGLLLALGVVVATWGKHLP
jgi:hypothetical protein